MAGNIGQPQLGHDFLLLAAEMKTGISFRAFRKIALPCGVRKDVWRYMRWQALQVKPMLNFNT